MMPFSFFVHTNVFTPMPSSETVYTAIRCQQRVALHWTVLLYLQQ